MAGGRFFGLASHRIRPQNGWQISSRKRCGAAAFEEIGVADLQTVSLVTAALAGKRYRATIGGKWKVASFIVDRMTRRPSAVRPMICCSLRTVIRYFVERVLT